MIIIEGSDKVGKSTLAQKLVDRINPGGQVEHWGLLPDDFDFFWGYEERAYLAAVWDRGWLSELAYQRVTSRPERMNTQHRIMVQNLLRLYGVVNVIITVEPSIMLQRLREKKDDKFNDAVVNGVNDWFISNYMAAHCTDVYIHCDGRKPYASENDIERILNLHHRRASLIAETIGDTLCLSKNPSMRLGTRKIQRDVRPVGTNGPPAG